jgi:phosphonate transport system substrate-binding protein
MSSPLPPAAAAPARRFSVRNVLLLALPLVAVIGGVGGYYYWKYSAQEAAESIPPFHLYLKQTFDYPAELDTTALADADGDMVADPPADPKKLVDPPTLVFAVLGSDVQAELDTWKDFLAHLEEATGRKVTLEHRSYINREDFVRLREGSDVHILQLNTGAVVPAVTLGGFVPLAVPAAADGSFGIRMEFIAPADYRIQGLEELGDKKVPVTDRTLALGNTRSFSGYRAPMALLMSKYGLRPYYDYTPIYGGTTADLILGIRDRRFRLAPVAGDYLKRRVVTETGDPVAERKIAPDQFHTVFTSDPYPPACVGVVHNLARPVRDAVAKAFVGYQFKGTSMEREFAPANQVQFVKCDYKKDWEVVRKVDDELRRYAERKP